MSAKYPTSAMSDAAIANDENMGVPLLDMDRIYSDHDFNCRDKAVTPLGSVELANSIAENGLLQAIVVRECGEQEDDPKEGYDYVIVVGHRRYQAYRINDHPVIPATMRKNQTIEDNIIANLLENLKRENLNLMEQANGLKRFHSKGWSREMMAQKLGMSPGWVQLRLMLLDLEPEVQEEFATGVLISTHIRQLYSYKNKPDEQLDLARAIKKARQSGDKRASTLEKIVTKNNKPKATSKKRRTPSEIEQMMQHLHATFGEYGLTGRALSWAAGHIANYEFYQDIRDECIDNNIEYNVPELEL